MEVCGCCEDPPSPSAAGFAAGGSWGIAVDAGREDDEPVEASVRTLVFEASERPGATAETRAANPAVSAAAPAITHRRVRRILVSAASRASTARDRLSFVVIRCPCQSCRVWEEAISAR